jgi:hypothetical protein
MIVPKKSIKFFTPPKTIKNNPMTSMRKATVAKTLSVICIASIVEAGRFFL